MRPKLFLRGTLALALIAGWMSYPPDASAQSLSFNVTPAFPAGTSPTSVAAGDFNGDGAPDLAVTNQHGVSILLNNGSGGFTVGNSYIVGTNPQSVAVGDFDGDGKLDLAVVNQGSGTVSILLGAGNGNFGGATNYNAGVNPRLVIVADLNGDGKSDLVVVDSGAAPGTSGVSILLGNGSGGFGAATFFAAGSVSLSADLVDFNRDGNLDLAVANSGSDNISILLGNGNGTFQNPVNISLDEPGISVSPTSIVAFLDNNARFDLAVATPNTRDITVLVGKGDGTFASPVHYALDDPNFVNDANKLAAFDLNGDFEADLVLCNLSSNHVTVLLGKGDGTFMPGVSYAAGPQPIGIAVSPVQRAIEGLGGIDLNGDGIADLVVANNAVDGEVTVLLGNGDGTLKAAPLYRSGYSPTSLAVGDLNNDGVLDIVTGSSVTPAPAGTGTGAAMLGNNDGFVLGKGGGTFRSPQVWSTSPISAVALADFDGDGKLDLVETNPNPGNGNVSVLLGKGDGTFQSAVNYTVGTTPEAVAVGDFNGDGKPDIVVGNRNSNNISVLLNSGNGTLQSAVNYGTSLAGTPESIAVGDFDGDGKLDIAVAISGINASEIVLFLGNGDGTFKSYLTIPAGFHSSAILHIVAADFDADGKADIAVTDGATLSILLGSGGAAFLTPVTYLVGPGAAINGTLAVADFNGDAKPDLVTTSRDGLAIFVNNDDGTFADPIPYSPFLGGAIAVGDFDGNGTPDIITADSSQDATPTDTAAVLINQTMGPQVPVTIDTSPSGVSFDVYYQGPPGGFLSEYTTCAAGPCSYNSAFGRFFQIYAPVIRSDSALSGLRYVLAGFSDNGTSVLESSGADVIHNIAVMAIPTYVTINYNTQELVTVLASPPNGGVVTPASGYFDANAPFQLTATANPGYTFQNWTASQQPGNPPVGGTCGTASCAQHVFAPVIWTANFTPVAVAVPNVVGLTQAAAGTAITGAGLVVGNIASTSSTTVAAENVISESPAAGTQVAPGSTVDLVISTGPPVVPHVVSFNVLFGSQSYNVIGSSRVHLPWQITGIRVVFSEPIASGGAASLVGGAAVSGFSGLGTNTLTWTITPIPIGSVPILLSGSGANALKDAGGNALNAGAGFGQTLEILWGDFNDDGSVSASDMVLVNTAISGPYNIFADMNGDGVVNAADVLIVRGRAGTHLP